MLATHEKPDTINLNVGGELFTTRLETLQLVKGSLLAKMFEDNSAYGKLPRDGNGVVFFDRDPKAFSSVLDFSAAAAAAGAAAPSPGSQGAGVRAAPASRPSEPSPLATV